MRKLNCEWIELPVGIALIALVIYIVITPDEVFDGVVTIGGLVAIVAGVAGIVRYSYFERRSGLSLLLSILAGGLCILAGTLIFLDFTLGVLSFTILAPIWFIVYCLSYLCDTENGRLHETDAPHCETPQD